MSDARPPVLAAVRVSKRFAVRRDLVARAAASLRGRRGADLLHAVSDVTLAVPPGQVTGLVGESGCGKSTLARMMAGLLKPSAGEIRFEGAPRPPDEPLLAVQMVFQDTMTSLNPALRVGAMLAEAPVVHRLVRRGEAEEYVATLMREVGLDPSYRDRFPHQFSGGQRQRIGIARALAVRPEVLICDEPVAALDVSVQAQILNLFESLRASRGLSYLFVSHNLAVVEHIADSVAVMYLGRIVETAPAAELFAAPAHPYTQALLAARPPLGRGAPGAVRGETPSPRDLPPGCAFASRCPHAFARCRVERPELAEVGPGHASACHLHAGAAR